MCPNVWCDVFLPNLLASNHGFRNVWRRVGIIFFLDFLLKRDEEGIGGGTRKRRDTPRLLISRGRSGHTGRNRTLFRCSSRLGARRPGHRTCSPASTRTRHPCPPVLRTTCAHRTCVPEMRHGKGFTCSSAVYSPHTLSFIVAETHPFSFLSICKRQTFRCSSQCVNFVT